MEIVALFFDNLVDRNQAPHLSIFFHLFSLTVAMGK